VTNEQNDIDDLISRCLAGEASAQEQNQLTDWLTLREENERYYQKLKRAFELSGEYFSRKAYSKLQLDVEAEWNLFLKNSQTNQTKVRSIVPQKNAYSMWRIAASVLLVVASGFTINYFLSSDEIYIETASNTQEVKLPDGSKVTLNRNSTLSYSKDFGSKKRTLRLTGEAFFDVRHDAQKPFVIEVNDALVEVLGTSFNVLGYTDQQWMEVVVETGTVKFSAPLVENKLILKAGERGVYKKEIKKLNAEKNNNVNFLSWKTKKIIFVETDLHTVVKTLNHAYQANIVLNKQVVGTCSVTVTFDQQSLEAILNVLKTTLNLTYKTNNGRIEITEAGC